MVSRQRFKNLADRLTNKTFSDFTKVIIIESLVETPDGQGGFTTAWSTFTTIDKGFVFVVNTSKMILDDHLKSKELKRFEFEYVAGILPNMRVNYDSNIYEIMPSESVLDSDIWIKIVASKDVAT